MPTVTVKFVQATYAMGTFVHISNILAVTDPILTIKGSHKKNYQILDIVQNSAAPPPSELVQNPPSPYRSLDILTQKVWNYKINFW